MTAQKFAAHAFKIGCAVAAGSFVYLWLVTPYKK